MEFHLTKSEYCKALRCPKLLWLDAHPQEGCEFCPGSTPQSRIDAGIEIGKKAWELFDFPPVIPLGDSAADQTRELLDKGTPYIAEATFCNDTLLCRVDILKNLGSRQVEIYEVKSSSGIAKNKKGEEIPGKPNAHLDDLAFQYYVLTSLGYTVRRACILHPNKAYILEGSLDWKAYFSRLDLTDKVRAEQANVADHISQMIQCLDDETEPQKALCEDCFRDDGCGYYPYCSRELPEPNVFQLTKLTYDKKLALYRDGFVTFEDLLKYTGSKPELTEHHRKQIDCALNPGKTITDLQKLRDFLSKENLPYPLYFLDFESFQSLIPLYEGTCPDQRIVFQYSLHVIDKEGAEVRHREFLGDPARNPHEALARQLCADIPAGDKYTVLAYQDSVEKSYIHLLMDQFPTLKGHLKNIHDHIQDLAVPFKEKYYYTGAMEGYYSIKKVLPALFPGEPSLDYHNLEGVHNGGEASSAYLSMIDRSPEEQAVIRQQLLTYCCLDTFGLVKIWQKLHETVDNA